MKTIEADPERVAYCGLYCGACGSYLRGRCAGCRASDSCAWCPVRKCCLDAGYQTCADCKVVSDPRDCPKFNSFIAKVIGFVLRSDRRACILQIREQGLEGHARTMAEYGRPSLRPGGLRRSG